jgi:hypothetical protein
MWRTFWLNMFCFSNTVFDLISTRAPICAPYQYSFRHPLSTCVWFMGRFLKKQNRFSWFFLVEFLHRNFNSWAQSFLFLYFPIFTLNSPISHIPNKRHLFLFSKRPGRLLGRTQYLLMLFSILAMPLEVI